MKIVLDNTWHTIVRFDQDEEVISGISRFAAEHNIHAAWLSAIGSSKEAELGYYTLEEKEYVSKRFTEALELVEASGTIALHEGKPVVHIHGVLSRTTYETIGGHIHVLVANATVEVFIHKIAGRVQRELDQQTGLKLLVD